MNIIIKIGNKDDKVKKPQNDVFNDNQFPKEDKGKADQYKPLHERAEKEKKEKKDKEPKT